MTGRTLQITVARARRGHFFIVNAPNKRCRLAFPTGQRSIFLFCFVCLFLFVFVFFGGVVLPNELVSATKIGFLFLSAENLVQGSVISQRGRVSLNLHRLLLYKRHKDGSNFLVCLLLICFPNLFFGKLQTFDGNKHPERKTLQPTESQRQTDWETESAFGDFKAARCIKKKKGGKKKENQTIYFGLCPLLCKRAALGGSAA